MSTKDKANKNIFARMVDWMRSLFNKMMGKDEQ